MTVQLHIADAQASNAFMNGCLVSTLLATTPYALLLAFRRPPGAFLLDAFS
jgi:hypothetical protein